MTVTDECRCARASAMKAARVAKSAGLHDAVKTFVSCARHHHQMMRLSMKIDRLLHD